jgi:hypothetical protein
MIEWLDGWGFYVWLGLLIGHMLGGRSNGLPLFPNATESP